MTLSNWKNKGNYFTFNGHQIFSLDEGEGAPLLLIHGFPTASWDWSKIWSELRKYHRVLAIDMLGFGFSDKPKTILTVFLNKPIALNSFYLKKKFHRSIF